MLRLVNHSYSILLRHSSGPLAINSSILQGILKVLCVMSDDVVFDVVLCCCVLLCVMLCEVVLCCVVL